MPLRLVPLRGLVWWCFLFLGVSPTAFAQYDKDPVKFFAAVQRTLDQVPEKKYQPAKHAVGQRKYVNAGWLVPGQPEISVLNSLSKLMEDGAGWGAKWRPKAEQWKLGQADGKSLLPLSEASQVVLTDFGMVIVDGHHHALANIYAGGTKQPVEIIGDYRGKSQTQVFAQLKANRQLYTRRFDGSEMNEFASLREMGDNPNRYLASLLAMKLKASYDGTRINVRIKNTPELPLWIKLNGGVPFIEFYLSQILKEAGIVYRAKWGNTLPTDVMTKARSAIADAIQSNAVPELGDVVIFLSDEQARSMVQNRELLSAFMEGYVVGKGLQCQIMSDAI